MQVSASFGQKQGGAGTGAAAELIKETTTAAFNADVIAESANQPVLVDFWAPWCGPCKQLTPIIERQVTAAKGRVKLVKMNIDAHPQIPGQLGIQSIPAIVAFHNGQPVDGFMGALPESQVKAFIDRVAGPSGADLAEAAIGEAETLAAEGDVDAAMGLYGSVLAQDPGNLKALIGLARLHLETGDIDKAEELLADLQEPSLKDPGVQGVKAAIEVARQAEQVGDLGELQARIAADPKDYQAQYELAIALNGLGKREEAVEALIGIIRRDRGWNEDGARKQLVQFFDAWGATDPATAMGRRRLSSVLFS